MVCALLYYCIRFDIWVILLVSEEEEGPDGSVPLTADDMFEDDISSRYFNTEPCNLCVLFEVG